VDLHRLADWLDACGVDTVAMESTGVYWIPLFELLESRGFTVLLANARHVKNVSGRKSDVLDCQWLQQLMSYGLLSGAFRPAEQVCVLRALTRQRTMLLRSQGRFVQHMQKALTQMNIQLANTISDVVGETGQKILRAIVAGERDGMALAKLKNVRIHASEEDIAKSLQGNWRDEHLFALKQAVAAAAHKLARLIYAMLTNGEEYTDRGQDYFEERYRQRVLHNLAQKAKAMGMQLVPSQSVT